MKTSWRCLEDVFIKTKDVFKTSSRRLHQDECLLGISRSSQPEVLLGKCVLKICSKFTGEHPRRSAISIKLQSNFIEITLRHGCSPVNLLNIFRTPFLKNTSRWLLLFIPSILIALNNHSRKKKNLALTFLKERFRLIQTIYSDRLIHRQAGL